MGGSSGGGGSSGAVTHSAYLEAVHADWLNATGTDTIEKSITEVMDSALGSSPWTGLVAYDPDADIATYEASLAAFAVILAGLSDTGDWAALYAQADTTLSGVGEAALLADAAAYEAILDDFIATSTLPKFRRGMQNINAVMSSSFVIGEAVIEAFKDRDVAKYLSTARLSVNEKRLTAVDQMMQLMARRIGWEESYAKMVIESMRIKIVAKKEETDQNAHIDESDAKWDLEVFQYGSNVLAAVSGGTASTAKAPSKLQSAIGGALTGAAAGAMIGMAMGPAAPLSVPMMALAGGILGGGSSFL